MSKLPVNKGRFIESLSRQEFDSGLIKFNIPNPERPESLNGEGVFGWVSVEDKTKYDDDTYFGEINTILLNQPLNYYGILHFGDEVVIKCNGKNRPTLDPEWIKEVIASEDVQSDGN